MNNRIHYADYETEKRSLAEYPMQTIGALYEFGILLIGEVQQRSNQIEVKFAAYLAAGAAFVALVGIGLPVHQSRLAGIAACSGFAAAILAMIVSAIGLRSQMWPFPSEEDWFNQREIRDHERLLRSYVLSLLLCHQAQQSRNASKAKLLPVAECLLAISLAATFLMLVTRI